MVAQRDRNTVQIVIAAKDEAQRTLDATTEGISTLNKESSLLSKSLSTTASTLGFVASQADFARAKLTEASVEVAAFAGSAALTLGSVVGKVGELTSSVTSLRNILDAPPVVGLIESIRDAAEEAVNEVAPLSDLLVNLGEVAGTTSQGFLSGFDIRLGLIESRREVLEQNFLTLQRQTDQQIRARERALTNLPEGAGRDKVEKEIANLRFALKGAAGDLEQELSFVGDVASQKIGERLQTAANLSVGNASRDLFGGLEESLGRFTTGSFVRVAGRVGRRLDQELAEQVIDGAFAAAFGEGPVQALAKELATNPQLNRIAPQVLSTLLSGSVAGAIDESLSQLSNVLQNGEIAGIQISSANLRQSIESLAGADFAELIPFEEIDKKFADALLDGQLRQTFGNDIPTSFVKGIIKNPLFSETLPGALQDLVEGSASGAVTKVFRGTLAESLAGVLEPLDFSLSGLTERIGRNSGQIFFDGLDESTKKRRQRTRDILGDTFDGVGQRLLSNLDFGAGVPFVESILPESQIVSQVDRVFGGAISSSIGRLIDKRIPVLLTPLFDNVIEGIGDLGSRGVANAIASVFKDRAFGRVVSLGLQESGISRSIFDALVRQLQPDNLKASFRGLDSILANVQRGVNTALAGIDGFLRRVQSGIEGIDLLIPQLFINVGSFLSRLDSELQSFQEGLPQFFVNTADAITSLQGSAADLLVQIDKNLGDLQISVVEFAATIPVIGDNLDLIINGFAGLQRFVLGLVPETERLAIFLKEAAAGSLNLASAFAGLGRGALSGLRQIVSSLSLFTQQDLGEIISGGFLQLNTVLGNAGRRLEEFQDSAIGGFAALSRSIASSQGVIIGFLGDIGEGLVDAELTVLKIINNFPELQSGVKLVSDTFSLLQRGVTRASIIVDALADSLRSATGNVGILSDSFLGFLRQGASQLEALSFELAGAFLDILPSGLEGELSSIIDGLIDFVGADTSSGFGQFFNDFVESARDAVQGSIPAFDEFVDSLEGEFQKIVQFARKTSNQLAIFFVDAFSSVVNFVNENFAPALQSAFQALDNFLGGELSNILGGIGRNAAGSFAKGFAGVVFQRLAPALDLIDAKIIEVFERVKGLADGISGGLDTITLIPGALSSFDEPLELFRALEQSVGTFASSISTVIERIGFFAQGLSALQEFVNTGPFRLFIGQTIELREQLLATQASIVGTSRVINRFLGQAITDPTQAITTLNEPVRLAIEQLREESLELVGVTSNDLVPIFQQIASSITSVNGTLKDAKDLSLDFAATLGTLNVPLFQSQQEIGSILNSQIDQNSVIAKALNITNEQVNKYKEQNVLIEELRKRLEAFRKGNALAAREFSGVTSNITEIFEAVTRVAGEKLLEPLLTDLNDTFNFLDTSRPLLVDYFSRITDELLTVGLSLSKIAKDIGQVFGGLVSEIPILLFKSLANAFKVLASSINATVQILQPAINLLSVLLKAAAPLSGVFLTIFLSVKSLSVGVNLLGKSFGSIVKLVPGLGELLFFLNLRTEGLVNQFTNLTKVVGLGAGGFLTLGQNLQNIPGAVNAVSQAFGPLGGIVANFVPTIAALGIQLVGLIKLFPPLGAFLSNLITLSPLALASITTFARGNAVLAPLIPLLDQATLGLTNFAASGNRVAIVNDLFRTSLIKVGKALAGQVIAFGLVAGAAFAAFLAFDRLVLQNKELQEAIGAISAGLVGFAKALQKFFTNPIVATTAAVVALAIAIRVSLIPSIRELVGTAFATWAFGAAAGLSELASVLATLRLATLAGAVTNLGVGIQSLGILFTQGSVAAAQFLAVNGTNVVTIGLLQTRLSAAIVSFKGFIASVLSAAVALIKNMVVSAKAAIVNLFTLRTTTNANTVSFAALTKSIVASSVAMIGNLIVGIKTAIVNLIALGVTANGTGFSFALLAKNIALVTIASGKALLVKVGAAASSLLGLGGAAAAASGTIGVLITALGKLAVAAGAVLAPIALIAAGIASIALVRYTKDLEESTKATESFRKQTNAAADRTIAVAKRLAEARKIAREADERGIALTKEQIAENKRLITSSNLQKQELVERIKVLRQFQGEAVGEENKRNFQSQIDLLERLKKSLENLGQDVKITPRELPRLGTVFEQLQSKAEGAIAAINNPSGDDNIFREKAQQLIEITQKQLELGQITVNEANTRFRTLATNSKATQELQLAAQQAIAESFKTSTQTIVQQLQTQQGLIEAQLAAGTLNFEKAAEAITVTQNQYLEERLRGENEYNKVRVEQINKEFDALKFQTEETRKLKLAEARRDPTSAAGQKAAEEAERLAVRLVNLEKTRNVSLRNEARRNAASVENLTSRNQERQTRLVARAAQLRGQVARGEVSQERAAAELITASRKAQLFTQLQAAKDNFEERKRNLEQETNEIAKITGDAVKAAQQDLIFAQSAGDEKRFKSAQKALEVANKAQENATKARNISLIKLEREYTKERDGINAEILNEEASFQKKLTDSRISEVERRQQQALDTLRIAQGERLAQQLRLQQQGLKVESEINEQRLKADSERIEKELELERKQLALLNALPLPKNQSEREDLENRILASRVRIQGLVVDSLEAERKEYEAHISKVVNLLELEFTARETQLEKQRNLGLVGQAEIDAASSANRVKILERQLQLETRDAEKRKKISLDLEKAKTESQRSNINLRLARLSRAADEENAILQRQINEGLLSESSANVRRAQQNIDRLEEQLALEANNLDQRFKLEVELEQAKTALIEAEVSKRQKRIETESLKNLNIIEEQNIGLQKQVTLYESLSTAIRQRNELLQAEQDLSSASGAFVLSQIDALSKIETSEFRRKQLAEITAAIKLDLIRQEQEFARENLKNEFELQKIAIEREKVENRIAQSRKVAAIVQRRAEIDSLKADPRNQSESGQARIRSEEIKFSADLLEFRELQKQSGVLIRQEQVQSRIFDARRRKQEFEQRAAETQAQADLVNALPPGRRGAARRSLQAQIAERFGLNNAREFRQAGIARSRALAASEFNIPSSPDLLGAIDPELGGLGDILSSSRFGNAVQAVQRSFASRFGNTANITGALTTPTNAQPLQLPRELNGILPVRDSSLVLQDSGILFKDGVSEFKAVVTQLSGLIHAGNKINLKVDANGRASTSTERGESKVDLERVIDLAKQMAFAF